MRGEADGEEGRGRLILLVGLLAGALVVPADAAKRKPKEVTREAGATYGLRGWVVFPPSAGALT